MLCCYGLGDEIQRSCHNRAFIIEEGKILRKNLALILNRNQIDLKDGSKGKIFNLRMPKVER